jgi:hypothetical protein
MNHNLYHAAINADNAWSSELTRVYGRNAGDARYDSRGYATPELKQLSDAFLIACEVWREEMRSNRDHNKIIYVETLPTSVPDIGSRFGNHLEFESAIPAWHPNADHTDCNCPMQHHYYHGAKCVPEVIA